MKSQEIIIYKAKDGKTSVAFFAHDGDIWLNQSQLAELFATTRPNISQHVSNILEEKELREDSVVKNYITTAADGKDLMERTHEHHAKTDCCKSGR
ncbi:MAG: hypothetical protein R8K50_05035 [Mariprofundus sp.]